MWNCPNCGETLDEAFALCWNCGTDREGRIDPEFEPVADDPQVPDPGLGGEEAISRNAEEEARRRAGAAAVPDEERIRSQPYRLVTVASFRFPFPAWTARNRLEEVGIPAIVADEQTSTMYWLYNQAIGIQRKDW